MYLASLDLDNNSMPREERRMISWITYLADGVPVHGLESTGRVRHRDDAIRDNVRQVQTVPLINVAPSISTD